MAKAVASLATAAVAKAVVAILVLLSPALCVVAVVVLDMLPPLIVLFVSVCVADVPTISWSDPAGRVRVLVTDAECGCDLTVWP